MSKNRLPVILFKHQPVSRLTRQYPGARVDVSYPAEVESFRAEVRAVLAEELPPGWAGIGAIAPREDAEQFAAQWRQALYRRGLLGITWLPEYGGRGLSRLHQVVLMEELAWAGVPWISQTRFYGN